ncbi:MAG: hypothetical protein AAFO07_34010, partial [Bacteroidota bacterium]
MRQGLLLILATIFSIQLLQAQPLRESSYEAMVETAKEQYELQNYYNCLEWYEKAYDESRDAEFLPVIAELHYMLRDYTKAERTYARILRRDKENKY